jgi:hypothetical protein
MSTETGDDPVRELFCCHVMEEFKRALLAHEALAVAYLERTGQVLERDSEYTVGDLKRASRLLRSQAVKL